MENSEDSVSKLRADVIALATDREKGLLKNFEMKFWKLAQKVYTDRANLKNEIANLESGQAEADKSYDRNINTLKGILAEQKEAKNRVKKNVEELQKRIANCI